jgi:hypothetical protein
VSASDLGSPKAFREIPMTCAQCGQSISGNAAHEYEGKQFCSQGCLDDFRRDTTPLKEPQN